MRRPFFEVDVFATAAFSGNPLAVVAEADDLSTEQMRAIANWTNFSETAFVLSPRRAGADYRVRIFTPLSELSFAGHPTLGTAAVVAELTGKSGDLVQECGIGLVTVRQSEAGLSFATPPLLRGDALSIDELSSACEVLGVAPCDVVAATWADNGPGWMLLQLKDAAAVRAVHPPRLDGPAIGLVGLEDSGPAAYEVRAFADGFEDPVTGSFNGAAAQFMRAKQAVPREYIAVQGSQLGRAGEVHILDDGTDIWVGGKAIIRVRGELEA